MLQAPPSGRLRGFVQSARASLIAGRFLRLLGWSSAATLFDRASLLLAVFVSARLIDGESFGRWGVAQSTVGAVQIFVLLGSAILLTRFVPDDIKRAPERAAGTIRTTLAIAAVALGVAMVGLVIFGDEIARTLFKEAPSVELIALLTVWLGLSAFWVLLQAALMALEDGQSIAISSGATGILCLALIPLGASTIGYRGMMAGVIAAEAVRVLILTVQLDKRLEKFDLNVLGPISKRDFQRLVTFGLPVFLQSLLSAPVMWLAQMIILQRTPNGLEQVGLFNYALLFFSVVLLVSTKVNQAAMPIMSSLAGEGRIAALARTAAVIAAAQLVAALVIAMPVFLMADWVLPPDYAGEALTIKLIALAGIVVAIQTMAANTLLVLDRQMTVLFSIVPWSVIMIGISWYFSEFGAVSLAAGLLIGGGVRTMVLITACAVTLAGAWRDLGERA